MATKQQSWEKYLDTVSQLMYKLKEKYLFKPKYDKNEV